MQELIDKIIAFRDSRGWDSSDTPEALVKSLVIEATELLENFQWGEASYDHENVKDELADILILLLALIHDLHLDPAELIDKKIVKIARKYPNKK